VKSIRKNARPQKTRGGRFLEIKSSSKWDDEQAHGSHGTTGRRRETEELVHLPGGKVKSKDGTLA